MRERLDGTLIGLGLAIGAGFGVTFGSVVGALTGDVGLWVALGIPIGGGIGLMGAVVWGVMKPAPAPAGECPTCGYDIRGLSGTTVCPECGTDLMKFVGGASKSGRGGS
jgi:hypothetical protein